PGEAFQPESSDSPDAVVVIASPTIPANVERLEAQPTDDGSPEIEALATSVESAIERPESAMRKLEMDAIENIEATRVRPDSVDRERIVELLAFETYAAGDVLLEVPSGDLTEQGSEKALRIFPPTAPTIQHDRTRAAMTDVNN